MTHVSVCERCPEQAGAITNNKLFPEDPKTCVFLHFGVFPVSFLQAGSVVGGVAASVRRQRLLAAFTQSQI